MRVQEVDPITDPLWTSLLARHSAGLFHSPLWLGAVSDAYGFDVRACVALNPQGNAVAGAAYSRLDIPPAPRLVVAPFTDSCDPLFDDSHQWGLLLQSLKSHELPIWLRCLDARIPDRDRFALVKRARWHSLTLGATQEERWRALSSSARRAVRKARKMGVEVRPLMPGPELSEFHRLHVALRRQKYGLLAQPLSFFEAIASHFRAHNCWYALGAWLDGRLIAATIYLLWGETLYYKFNASSLHALPARPNSLLAWAGIELAASIGCRRLDLGPSDDDQPGLIRFKAHLGASEKELLFLRLDPPGWDNAPADLERRRLGELTRQFTHRDVPEDVAARAGAQLYRYFA